MSAERDETRIVRSWLEDGVTALPDRVLDAVLDQLPATPQRRTFWLARRFTIMNNTSVRYGVAAVAVIAAVILGLNLLPRDVGDSPVGTPSPTPSLSAQAPRVPDGSMEAGTYALHTDLSITIDVPDGWTGCCLGVIEKGGDQEGAAMIAYVIGTDIVVWGDPCNWDQAATTEPIGAEAIAAALAAQPGRTGTEPTAITVDGVAGLHVRLTVPDDLEVTPTENGAYNFVGCDEEEYRTFGTDSDPQARFQQRPGQIDDLYIVDVGDRTVIFDVTYGEETPALVKAELEAVIASIQIE